MLMLQTDEHFPSACCLGQRRPDLMAMVSFERPAKSIPVVIGRLG